MALLLAAVTIYLMRNIGFGKRCGLDAPSFVFKARLFIVVTEATDLVVVLLWSYESYALLCLRVRDNTLGESEILACRVLIIFASETPSADLTPSRILKVDHFIPCCLICLVVPVL